MKTKALLINVFFFFFIGAFNIGFKAKPKTYNELKVLSSKIALRQYQAKVNILFYADQSSNNSIESKHLEFSCWGKFSHYKAEHIEAFSDNEIVITINHRKKLILVNPNINNSKNEQLNNVLPFALDTVFNKIYQIQKIDDRGNISTFLFKNRLKGNKINKILFKIDDQSVVPVSCEIFYSEKLQDLMGSITQKKYNKEPKLLMEFNEFRFVTKFKPELFDFSRILKKEGKFLKLTQKFSDYELLNNYVRSKKAK